MALPPRHTDPAHQSMMLVDNAAEKPRMLKLISVAVHSASPPMTGMRERLTNKPAKNGTRNISNHFIWEENLVTQ